MQGYQTATGLWLPGERKREGGTWFDDELDTARRAIMKAAADMIRHINERPDHVVYVSCQEDREMMRSVLDWFKNEGMIGHKPPVKIEYGLPEGQARVAP